MAEVTLVRCIGCDTPLGNLPLTEGAKAHVATCEKHPLRPVLVELRSALGACLRELEAAIRALAEAGLVPQAINYRNRERWAALARGGVDRV